MPQQDWEDHSQPPLPSVTNIISWAASLSHRLTKHCKPTTSFVINVAASVYIGFAYKSPSLCFDSSDSCKSTASQIVYSLVNRGLVLLS